VARAAESKPKADLGPIYRGREGQWSWVLHRVTGVVIILFLFAHIVDTAVVGWGPEAYDKVIRVYQNPYVGVLELVLVGCVVYHALNGVRIMVMDFWPRAAASYRAWFYGTMAVFVASMIPITVIMGNRIIQELTG
jgi:succinate dehydrogenase / fumarate reductase cytochrome b subunit